MKFKSDIEIQAGVEAGGSTGSNGQVLSSTGSSVAWINQGDITSGEAEVAKSLQVTVKNVSGGELTKGTVVHTAPTASPPSGNVIEVIAADYDDTAKMPAIGILKETIANEAEGEAVMTGTLSGIATDGFSIGDELYVGADGALTNVKPQTAGQLIQKIAVCVKSHASNGLIKIFGAGRSNDVPLPLYIDNTNQRLGIGTPSPSATLELNSDTGNAAKLKIGRQNGATNYLELGTDGGSSTINAIGIAGVYADLIFNRSTTTATNESMRITSSGNVGIGTTDPSEKLNVSGNILATGTILGSNLSGTNTGDQDLSGYALTDHNHDDRYYTETESDNRFVNVSGDTMTGDLTIDNNTPRIDFKSDESGSDVGGRIELNENGNLWVNAQGGKDLWLNWVSPNSPASKSDLNVGDGNSGSYILRVEGDSRTVLVDGNISVTGTVDGVDISALPTTFAPVDAEQNVQSDWDEETTTSDAFILNKPTIPTDFVSAANGGTFGNALAINHSAFTGLTLSRSNANGSSIDFNNSEGLLGRIGYLSNGSLAITNGTAGTSNMMLLTSGGNATFAGDITADNLSGSNTGDQDLSGYALTDHNHDDRYLRTYPRHQANLNTINSSGVYIWDVSEANDDPSGSVDGLLTVKYWDSTNWATASYQDFHNRTLHIKSKKSGTWQTDWAQVWTTDQLTTTDKANYDTAYGWGDHSTEGYLTSLPSHNHDSDYFKILRGSISLTGSNPFDDAKTETQVTGSGSYVISYTGASAHLISSNVGGSASMFQIGAHYNGSDFYMRTRTDSSTWQTWKKIWHSGNLDTSDFATSDHNHNADYVNVTGDTMTGSLAVNGTVNSIQGFSSNGSARKYFWRSDNTLNSGVIWRKIGTYNSAGQSSRIMITATGTTSYGAGTYPGKTTLIAQVNNNNLLQGSFWQEGMSAQYGSFGIVSNSATDHDIYYQVGSYSEYAYEAIVSDGTFIPDSTTVTEPLFTDVPIRNWNVNNELFVNPSGKVGIGETSPEAKLEVGGNIAASDQVSVNNRTAISVAHWSGQTATTGAIKISLPGSHGSNWSMLVLRITTYEYNSNNHTVYYVSGHDWTSGWYNNGVTKIGDSDKDISLAYDSNKDYVIVGETTSSWSYGHVTVDVMAHPSFYSGSMDIRSGWGISQDADLTGITIQAVTNRKVLTSADAYYTESESDDRFVNVTGDTMTGDLTLNGNFYLNPSSTEVTMSGNTSGNFTIDNNTGQIAFQANGSTVNSMTISSSQITLNEISQVNNTLRTLTSMGDTAQWDSAVLRLESTDTINTTGFQGLRFSTSTADNYGWRVGANRRGSGRGSLRFYEHTGAATGFERFTIAEGGNVGIGTPSPVAALQIYNGLKLNQNGTLQWGNSGGQGILTWDTSRVIVKGSLGNELHLGANNSNSNIVVKSNGNVGIGTTSPKSTLDVKGGYCVDTKSVSITQSPTTVLTVRMSNHTGCYVKLTAFGDWGAHSSIAYLGEFFLQNGADGYAEPGAIIRQEDNTHTDAIQAEIVDPGGTGTRDFTITLRATASASFTAQLTYNIQGQFISVS